MKRFRIRRARLQSGFYLRLLKIMGLCGAGFLASCAKYGTPEPEYGIPVDNEIRFHGNVHSADSLKDIPALTVRLVKEWDSTQVMTNEQGEYDFYYWANQGETMRLKFIDTDSSAHAGWFMNKTVNVDISGRDANNGEHQEDVLLEKK